MEPAERKALYHGVDTRKNLYELEQLPEAEERSSFPDLPNIKTKFLAVACLMTTHQLVETDQDYRFTDAVTNLMDRVRRKFPEAPLSPTEKFRTEPAPGFGTAFLVGRQRLLTAGHCISSGDTDREMTKPELQRIRVVFNYHKTRVHDDKTRFDKNDVYKIRRTIWFSYRRRDFEYPDWAIVKLDRPVDGITPIPMNVDYNSLRIGQEIYVLGCPNGIAVKFAGPSTIQQLNHHIAKGDLDIFGGNSGGPVIDRATQTAIGILVSGPGKEYEYDKKHEEEVGGKRVIAFRITPEMIAKGLSCYSGFQRITPQVIDPMRIIAKRGRVFRQERSDRRSEQFLQGFRDNARFGKKLMLTVIGVIAGALITQENFAALNAAKLRLRKFEQQLNSQECKLNALEADAVEQIKTTPPLTLDERVEIAKLMCGYDFTYENAYLVSEWSLNVFNNRFSPDKVWDLLLYQSENQLPLTFLSQKRILKYLQKDDYECVRAKLGIEESPGQRRQAIVNARIRDCTKFIKKECNFRLRYPTDQYRHIAHNFVVNHSHSTLEEAIRSSPLYGQELDNPA